MAKVTITLEDTEKGVFIQMKQDDKSPVKMSEITDAQAAGVTAVLALGDICGRDFRPLIFKGGNLTNFSNN